MIDKHLTATQTPPTTARETSNNIDIYYRTLSHQPGKKDEKAIRDIVKKNVTPVMPDHRIRLKMYYKTPRTSSLVMRNNQQKMTTLQEANVVYRFQCSTGDCATRNVYYIGLTITSLSRRLTMHLQEGGSTTPTLSFNPRPDRGMIEKVIMGITPITVVTLVSPAL